ncbi:hypothetical protein [Actinoplanes sp. OR16]|uniref:hypothetical protein n=1 Tax=Actinoplanes sp. OR16 TaxID=946334 RepID=UPI000FDC2F8B|nr:hypothetical protein [Actinoplanes sp. OR16]
MTSSPSTRTPTSTRQPLAEAVVALAGTPDDMPDLDTRLKRIAELAADRIGGVDYAAIRARPDDGSCVVAVGEALEGLGTTAISWPGFRDEAAGMGLAVVSVPLTTGSGARVATLDLYGSDPAAITALGEGISAAFDPDLPLAENLDAGGEELVNGLAEAVCVRETLQLALTLMEGDGEAYPRLRLAAADQGVSLLTAATRVIAR